jgi:predicted DNA-binding protein (MmcQ/YjbR family)
MVTFKTLQVLALSFPEVNEQPHFHKVSFRVTKKIFATHDEKTNRAVVKLSAAEQDVFCLIDKAIIYPVPNKWGTQGWTMVEMKLVKKELFAAILKSAYENVSGIKFPDN